MSERPYKPKGWPTLTPYLTVKDAKRSIDFYERAFGFAVEGQPLETGGKITHVSMKLDGAAIMFSPEGSWDSTCKAPRSIGVKPAISLYIYCPDVDAVHARAVKSGARSLSEPQDMFWGDRMCQLEDPDGYIWSFATNVGDFDPTKMPVETTSK